MSAELTDHIYNGPQEIKLTRGYVTLVSPEDYEWLCIDRWHANVGPYQVRAIRFDYRQGRKQMLYMHRVIVKRMYPGLLRGEIDHIDRNPLNNIRENLRVVSHKENMRNTAKYGNRKGYCWNKRAKLYYVYLDQPDLPRINLGYTKTEEEAIARVAEARKNAGL